MARPRKKRCDTGPAFQRVWGNRDDRSGDTGIIGFFVFFSTTFLKYFTNIWKTARRSCLNGLNRYNPVSMS
jgi:hypothetical protein